MMASRIFFMAFYPATWLKVAALSVGTLAFAAVATPAGETAAQLLNCRQIPSPMARVACYDAISVPGPDSANSSTRPQITGPSRPHTTDVGAAAGVPPYRTAPVSDPAAFGLAARETAAVTNRLDGVIAGNFDGWMAQSKIRLTNGQIWQISDGSEGAYRLRDPKVQIHRTAFGSYFMQIEGVHQTPKVRRIE